MTKSNESEKAQAPAAIPKAPEKPISLWDALAKDSKCLARSTEPGEDGYYLAVVEEVSPDGKTLTLKWAGYPKLETFKARRMSVGLLSPVK